MKNRRGQIGETMTWVVATLVIVVILSISIFAVTLDITGIKNSKKFKWNRDADLLATKSLVNYLMESEVYEKLKESGKLNESGEKIVEYYEKDYVGSSQIEVEEKFGPSGENEVLGVGCDVDVKIDLDDGKEVLLCLGSE
ncbi:hypothetical protein GOV13_00690 [Candidatus Pacearchaeota archaeon]|nr:hypothetical protein [Candidatus Pacearchaeota archaeon]